MAFNPGVFVIGIISVFFYWIITKILGSILPEFQNLFAVGSTSVYIIALIPTAIFFGLAYRWIEQLGIFGSGGQ